MATWNEPVTNRGSNTCKYNVEDLNRVEGNTQFLSDLLSQCGYSNSIVAKTDWVSTGIGEFTPAHSVRIAGNVRYLCDIYALTGIDLPGSMTGINYVDANNIELNLKALAEMIDSMIYNLNNFKRCNTFYSGGNPVI